MEKKWWQKAVGYEIYCKSFCDSNGDGIGDLQGVKSKLEMLRDLGVTLIWFAPIYKSPQVDNGYDVADYQDIDPDYGTLEDFKEVLEKAHSLGIRVIMDMVLNHSSDEHPWFVEARKSKDNPYRNYYIWQPPRADGSEPNNWGNVFHEGNGSAWTLDETTGEYYLHLYSRKMPDLNWEYEPLRQEIYKMLHWWLDLGVDGFRLDVVTRFKKTPGFPDSTKKPDELDLPGFVMDAMMFTHVDGIHDLIHGLYKNVFGPRDCFTVGEGANMTAELAPDYILPEREELNSIYHFQLASRMRDEIPPHLFRSVQTKWADILERGGWSVQYMTNHDSQRQVSCYGSEKDRVISAKLLATLIHTTPGIPFIYQGEEIGMTNVRFDSIDDYNCCYTMGAYQSLLKKGKTVAEAMEFIATRSRDNARTPYQWDDTANAGFTTGKPWLKLNPNYKEINLEKDLSSPDSIFRYYQALTKMRREHPALVEGNLVFYLNEHPKVLAYTRKCKEETLLVIANYSKEESEVLIPSVLSAKSATLLLANTEREELKERMVLAPWECAVFSLQ